MVNSLIFLVAASCTLSADPVPQADPTSTIEAGVQYIGPSAMSGSCCCGEQTCCGSPCCERRPRFFQRLRSRFQRKSCCCGDCAGGCPGGGSTCGGCGCAGPGMIVSSGQPEIMGAPTAPNAAEGYVPQPRRMPTGESWQAPQPGTPATPQQPATPGGSQEASFVIGPETTGHNLNAGDERIVFPQQPPLDVQGEIIMPSPEQPSAPARFSLFGRWTRRR